MSGLDRQVIFSLAKAKVPDLSSAKGGGSLTPDKGKSAPRKPTVIDCSSLNLLWADMMEKATVDDIGSFLYHNGLFEWPLAKMVKEFDNEDHIISIPTVENDSISSVLFAYAGNGGYAYWHIRLSELEGDTQGLIDQYGAESLIIAIFAFLQYEQVFGNYQHKFLYLHFAHEALTDLFLEISPRGWCLIEVELQTFNQDVDDIPENCNCSYRNFITGTEIMNPPTGVHPSNYDDTWVGLPAQEHMWAIHYSSSPNSSIIHGNQVSSDITVYHFWAWCPDEIGQDPWAHNWTTNISPGSGGNGDVDTGPNWNYDRPRWTEDDKDCMFAFNHPQATELINQLEEQLLSQSCGEAAEFNILSIIDSEVLHLCNEYYDNQEGDGDEPPMFPGAPAHNMNESLDQITEAVEGNSYYQVGMEICEVCDNAMHPSGCYDAVNNCGTEGYEECVDEILCGYSLQAFRAKYNLNLPHDDACIDNPLVVQFLLEHQEEVQFSEEEIQWLLENQQVVEDILEKVENPDVIEEIIDLLFKHNLHLPCSPGITSEAVIASVVNNENFQNNPEVETFYQTLAEEDYIIEDASFMSCTYAQCIYDKILASDNPSNCKLVNPLFNDDDFGLVLHLSDTPYSYTTFDNESNMANMYISLNCNGTQENDLDIAASIIHELIHAEIMMTLFELGLNPNNLESFDDAWDNYQLDYMLNLKNTYDLNDIHHAVMVFVEGDDDVPGGGAVDRIAKILWELNGQQLTIEHYYHLAWGGLRYIDSQWAEDEYGTNSEYYNLHQELLTLNPNLSLGC